MANYIYEPVTKTVIFPNAELTPQELEFMKRHEALALAHDPEFVNRFPIKEILRGNVKHFENNLDPIETLAFISLMIGSVLSLKETSLDFARIAMERVVEFMTGNGFDDELITSMLYMLINEKGVTVTVESTPNTIAYLSLRQAMAYF